MVGKIDLFYDCVSPYSWFALDYLVRNQKTLRSYGVEYELHPVFLGGIMNKSGNVPPWSLKAKANYGNFDRKRAEQYFGMKLTSLENFPILSLLPQRALTYIKTAHPASLERATTEVFRSLWQNQEDLSKPDLMRKCLGRAFSSSQVDEILKACNSKEAKDGLLATTDRALASGAFGCPWFEVTNSEGKKEPFFGSDRFHYMWQFLGIPWRDVEIVERERAKV